MDGVTVCTNDVDGLAPDVKACGNSMEISDKGLGGFCIISDFSVQTSEKCELMSWDEVMTVVEELAEQKKLSSNFWDETAKIVNIELKYLIVPEGGTWEFHPVWSFDTELSWKGGLTPFFAINAVTGELEFMNAH